MGSARAPDRWILPAGVHPRSGQDAPGCAPASGARFEAAVASVLVHLARCTDLALWMVTRLRDGGADGVAVVVDARDRGYGIRAGRTFPWADLPCKPMAEGRGPRVAPVVGEVPAYARAPLCAALPVGAYAGVPLRRPDGALFGTLCGMDPHPRSERLVDRLATLELLGELLGVVLAEEAQVAQARRRVELAEREAVTDPLTGAGNRRLWDKTLASEEARCRRYGSVASLVSVDLDGLKHVNDARGHGAGDALLRRAAYVLEHAKRSSDVVARLGGDEFGVLAVECDEHAAAALAARIRAALAGAGIRASVGHATRRAAGLPAAWHEADAAMYADKHDRTRPPTA